MGNERKLDWKEAAENFREYLTARENAAATVEKYLRDIRTLREYAESRTQKECGGCRESELRGESVACRESEPRRESEPNRESAACREERDGGKAQAVLNKEMLLEYRRWLMEHYAVNSANSMIAALNQFLICTGNGDLRIRQITVQRQRIREAEREMGREEFRRLVRTAREGEKPQLAMLMETICATGIRVSELKYFTAEAVRKGVVKVWNKGKYRLVLIADTLKKKLLAYMGKRKIKKGPVFCTRSGKAKDRSNIWKEMKQLSEEAGVDAQKVFSHNLRHLFARTFYKTTKNLINLADILGHSSLEVTRIYTAEGQEVWRRNLEQLNLIET